MDKLHRLPTWSKSGPLHVVVESPRASQLKLKYDPELAAFGVGRALPAGLIYPHDWGFVPGTRAEDGDPLDAMILSEQPSYPGVVWACEPIAVVQVTQPRPGTRERVRNDRILAVPTQLSHGPRDLGDLAARERAELEQFFLAAVALDKPGVQLIGWADANAARETVRRYET